MKDLLPFIISGIFGFLVGMDREKKHSPTATMGIRTFTLIAILGSIAGKLQEIWLSILLGIFTLGLVLLAYYRETGSSKKADRGLTTEVAAGIVFALSYTSHQNPALAALLGSIVALLLFWKEPLHRFTKSVSPRELEAALLLMLLSISVLSVFEDKVIDPWGLFNPRKFGMIVMILALIEFSSYLAVKFLGHKKSTLIIGFFAGLVSSTALVLSAVKLSKENPQAWRRHVAMATIGTIASLIELVVVIGITSPRLISYTSLILAGPLLFGAGMILWLMHSGPAENSRVEVKSPLDILGILRLSIFLAAILALVALAQEHIGHMGRDAAVLIASLVELHGGSIAAATLFENGKIELSIVLRTIGLAIVASLIAKIIFTISLARSKFSAALSIVFFIMAAATLVSLWIVK